MVWAAAVEAPTSVCTRMYAFIVSPFPGRSSRTFDAGSLDERTTVLAARSSRRTSSGTGEEDYPSPPQGTDADPAGPGSGWARAGRRPRSRVPRTAPRQHGPERRAGDRGPPRPRRAGRRSRDLRRDRSVHAGEGRHRPGGGRLAGRLRGEGAPEGGGGGRRGGRRVQAPRPELRRHRRRRIRGRDVAVDPGPDELERVQPRPDDGAAELGRPGAGAGDGE